MAETLDKARAIVAAAISKAEESLNAGIRELRAEADKVKASRKNLDRAYVDLELERRAFSNDQKQAQVFTEAWKSIPEAERSPTVKKALAAAAPIVSPSKGPQRTDDAHPVTVRPRGPGIE
ncbi:MAG: hypothetical protein EON93_13815 [Burkholderiales bacterium]|nr:MAG: hypothetical protein EON93_13815 [Burkholderiales bacterium]